MIVNVVVSYCHLSVCLTVCLSVCLSAVCLVQQLVEKYVLYLQVFYVCYFAFGLQYYWLQLVFVPYFRIISINNV